MTRLPADRPRRVAVVGVDGFSPVWMARFLRQGRLPAIDRVRRAGAVMPLVSTLPATTPVAWASITTGAMPSSTGIEGFLVHQPGDPLDERVSGCYSYRCRAETVWDAAAAAGLRSCVVKFPGSYPSTTSGFRADGAAGWGGLKCLHEAASRATVDSTRMATAGEGRWRWSIPTIWGGPDVVLDVSVCRGRPGTVEVSTPDGSTATVVSVGEWSAPIIVTAAARRGDALVAFRVKAVEAVADPPWCSLVHTALHECAGHSEPAPIWERVHAEAGPIEEQTEPSLFLDGQIDLTTQLELFGLNAAWLADSARTLLRVEPWDLFMTHIHIVDWAHHVFEAAVDPRHPDHDPATASTYEAALLQAYRLADELVDAVVGAVGPDVDVLVVGDHGQDLRHTTFRANEWLASRGLLRWKDDDECGGMSVDWSDTRAMAAGNYIHFNVLGREPTGLVTPAEAARLEEQVVDGLLNLTDGAGTRPVLVAAPKSHFEAMGADGDGVGDVVFCLRSGYEATNGRGAVLSQTRALREFTSGHDHFWPLDPRIHTAAIAAGPHVTACTPRLGHVTDMAPTIAALLGIEPPAQSTGHPLPCVEADQDSRPVVAP